MSGRAISPLLGGGAGGGVVAVYRSVLFVSREREEREGGGEEDAREGERGGLDGDRVRPIITLKPAGGRKEVETEGGGDMNEEREGGGGGGVYRKTLYRTFSRQEAIEGWRHVKEEESRVATGDGERTGAGVMGGAVKRYSVILREERNGGREVEGERDGGKEEWRDGERDGGRGVEREEVEWVVEGWEVSDGQRSSWGAWLSHFLPSMPWAVTPPIESGGASERPVVYHD